MTAKMTDPKFGGLPKVILRDTGDVVEKSEIDDVCVFYRWKGYLSVSM